VKPLQLDNEEDGDYWMPAWFTEWRGRSLVTADTLGLQLSGTSATDAADAYSPVGADAVDLRYGHSYDFPVRLADISGGGPAAAVDPVDPAPAPVATCAFRRLVPPREVTLPGAPAQIDPTGPPTQLSRGCAGPRGAADAVVGRPPENRLPGGGLRRDPQCGSAAPR